MTIAQRFFFDGDRPDAVSCWHCLGCGAKVREGVMTHHDICPEMGADERIRELREAIAEKDRMLARKDRELAALHIWGAPEEALLL
jgi:hypothetical protein